MGISWITVAIAVGLLVAAAPWVAWVRHPRQRPFAAYLTFVCVFALMALVLFLGLAWLVTSLGLAERLGRGGMAFVLLAFGVLPAFVAATWQARRPPSG